MLYKYYLQPAGAFPAYQNLNFQNQNEQEKTIVALFCLKYIM